MARVINFRARAAENREVTQAAARIKLNRSRCPVSTAVVEWLESQLPRLTGQNRPAIEELGWAIDASAGNGYDLTLEQARQVRSRVLQALGGRAVCPNCDQWQHPENGGDCFNECVRRGFAPAGIR